MLHLVESLNSSSIARVLAFSADADTSKVGDVFYQESRDPALLQKATDITNMAFPGSNCAISALFIATWFYVGYFDHHDDKV